MFLLISRNVYYTNTDIIVIECRDRSQDFRFVINATNATNARYNYIFCCFRTCNFLLYYFRLNLVLSYVIE